MALGLYTLQERTQTRLCYHYRPIAKEELGQGEQQQMEKGALIKGAKQR